MPSSSNIFKGSICFSNIKFNPYFQNQVKTSTPYTVLCLKHTQLTTPNLIWPKIV